MNPNYGLSQTPAPAAIASGLLPANGRSSLEMIARKRKLAEAMMGAGLDTSPIGSWTQGAARMMNAGIGGYDMYKANTEETAGRAAAKDRLMKALAGNNDAEIMGAIDDPFMSQGGESLLMDNWRNNHDPARKAQLNQLNARGVYRNSLDPSEQKIFDADPDAYMKFAFEKKQADANASSFNNVYPVAPNGAPNGAAPPASPADTVVPGAPPPMPGSTPGGQTVGATPPAAVDPSPGAAAAAVQIPPQVIAAARQMSRKDPAAALKMINDYQIEMEKAAATQGNQRTDNISQVRKEIKSLPSYISYSSTIPIYHTMVEASQHNTKAADLNLVYGLAKIFDPTSVVKEGEVWMVKNTANLPDYIVGAINGINGGQQLQGATRKAMLIEAQSRINSYKSNYEDNLKQYYNVASHNNYNLDEIIPSFGELPALPGTYPEAEIGLGGTAPAENANAVDLNSKYGLKKVNP